MASSMACSWRLTFLLILVVGVAGCARTVRIAGVRPLVNADVSHRQWLTVPFGPDGEVQPDYRLGLADAVEITVDSQDPPGVPITVQTYCEINGMPCDGSFPSSGVPANGRMLLENQWRPRVPLATLGSVGGLRITAPTATPYCVSLWSAGQFRIDPDPEHPPTWRDVQAILRSGATCPDATGPPAAFRFRLVAAPKQRALPGDKVAITILSRLGTAGDSPHAYAVAQVSSTVDRWGHAFVPGLKTATSAALKELPASSNPANPVIRQWADAFDMTAYRLRLWSSQTDFDRQMPLDEVALCLSAGWSGGGAGRPPWIAKEIRRCELLGADPEIYIAGSQDIERLRYQIESIQTWTLVLPDGSALIRPYVAGQTVGDAARQAGRDIAAHAGRSERSAFVTVVPDAAVFEREPNRRAPFWAPFGRRERVLDTVLLIPGDTVHLTFTRPRSR